MLYTIKRLFGVKSGKGTNLQLQNIFLRFQNKCYLGNVFSEAQLKPLLCSTIGDKFTVGDNQDFS